VNGFVSEHSSFLVAIADTEQVGNFAPTTFQAIMPNASAMTTRGNRNSGGGTARFAVNIWGENAEAGKASTVVIGAVAVGLVGAGWADLVEQASFDHTGLGGGG
jgi:hypothetical protein